ncbi:MAG: OmpA family protein [Flavipsychrobacter sp.]|nr:OmpA family protein [Flavipsychrobacter sp.]
MRLKLTLLTVFTCLLATAFGQAPPKAVRHYEQALEYNAKWQKDDACNEMWKAIAEYPAYTDAYSVMGEWYYKMHKYTTSSFIFNQAMKNCKNGYAAFARPYARSLLYDNQPDSALAIIGAYMPAQNNAEWKKLEQQANFVRKALLHPVADTPVNMGPRINTTSPEMFPSLSADSLTFYFTRRHNNIDEDFYYALPDSCGGWHTAKNMGAPLNTPDQESAQMVSADGHYLFFTRCENRSENGWGQGGCDLYLAYRNAVDSAWSAPESFGATINTPDYEGMPCLSADNRELFFASNRPGGYGGYDLYVARFDNGLWLPPQNLGPTINTAGNETAPYLHIDNHTLYFTSDGHPGMGGKDIFVTRRYNDSMWSPPYNMGYPINSTGDENSVSVTMDGKKMYLSSDKNGIEGDYDIYECPMPDAYKPLPVCALKGYVFDSISKEKLNYASIYINDAQTGTPLYHFLSNRGDGSYMITLIKGKKYVLQADRIGYTDLSDTLYFNSDTLPGLLNENIALLSQDYVKPINDSLITIINFPLNSATLTDSDKIAIQQVLSPWLLEKGVVIMINGYTDNTGTPMLNEHLSYVRAGLVKTEILKYGIDEAMMKAQGWGEASPISTNDTEEGRDKNRRVEVVIRR